MTGTRRISSIDRLLSLAHRGPEAGSALDEAKANLAELQAMLASHQMDFGGAPEGKLNISVKFKRSRRGAVEFEVVQTITGPKPPAAGGAAFVDHDGQLSLDDPHGESSEIRDASAGSSEIRTAGKGD